MGKKTKVLVLDSGLHQQKAFDGLGEMKAVSKIRPRNLLKYDVIIVPTHTDQIALARLRDGLKKFLDKSGVLILLGVTQYSTWLPDGEGTWNSTYPEKCSIVQRFEEDTIFRDLCSKDLKYHTSYSGHGFLIPPDNEDIEKLVTCENNNVLMYRYEHLNGGVLLVTTLDPDFHSVSCVPGPSEQESTQTRVKARTLLKNITTWAERKSNLRSRKLRSITLWLYWLRDMTLFGIAIGIPGLVGYIISPYFFPNLPPAAATWLAAGAVISVLRWWESTWAVWKKQSSNQ